MTDEQQIIFRSPEKREPIGDIDRTQEGWCFARGDVHHGEWVREHHDINHDPHFTKWCADWIETGTAVVDIGANIGTHSVPYLQRGPAWLVSIEPSPTLFECLRRNLLRKIAQLVPASSVMAYCCAAGADFGNGAYHYNQESPGTSFVTEGTGIEIRPLGHLLEFLPPDSLISFIKIDVEGYEPFVIQGAESILHPKFGKHRPVIIMEMNNVFLERQGWSAAKMFELMESIHYKPLGTWPPEYDRLSRDELLAKPVFEKCFVPQP